MAAHLTASLAKGILTIAGTEAADVITVAIQAPARGNRGGSVAVDGVIRTFQASKVKRIVILGGEGDDVIAVRMTGRSTIPVRISGGGGNDTINGVPEITPAPTPMPVVPSPAPVIPPPVATPPALPPTLSAVEQRIVDLTNVERLRAGLAPLTVSVKLEQAAQIQSGNMARLETMAHVLPNTAQPYPGDRAAAVGYKFSWLGENIAYNYADAVVAGWMALPGHRANIL